jgi:uncharacterized protein with PIN domain
VLVVNEESAFERSRERLDSGLSRARDRLARQAYAAFGRGSGHRAGLNFGHCLSYALALDTREPLLWKGENFGHTGIASALKR